jgi:hypothetical protein
MAILPIFCEKMAFILKTNVVIQFLHKLAVFRVNSENLFSNLNKFILVTYIDPWWASAACYCLGTYLENAW